MSHMFRRHKHRPHGSFEHEFAPKGNYGLELCHQDDEAIADVVFVHGLTGDRRSTWTDKSSNVFWPKDLLGCDDLPPMRILSYGYDADVAHFWAMGSQNRIGEHAGNLVNALAQLRDGSDTEERPIIFVAHSLGGLVTEDAILFSKSSAETYLQDIFESVSGVCFLGTPHCGSDFARWASVATSLVNTVKTVNKSLVKTLTLNSEVLARVQRDFQNEHRKMPSDKTFGITCFYEEIPLRGIGEVVPKHSATLPQYNAISIHANHMDMVRFSSKEDSGYRAVTGEIRRWLKVIRTRNDTERLPEVVDNVFLNDVAPQPSMNGIAQSTSTVYEPSYSHSYSQTDVRTPENITHEPIYRSELAQPYSHLYGNHHTQSHVPSQPMYHNSYTHADQLSRSFNTLRPLHSQPRPYPRTYNQDYTPYEPAHQYSPAAPSSPYQSQAPYESVARDPRTYSNSPSHNTSPHPRFGERGQGSVYQESSHFGETDNKGGKMLQGNYNVTGNISF